MEQAIFIRKLVGDIQGEFLIPGYQRGYRWDKQQVEMLLDDIWNFHGESTDYKKRRYFLQPIVVKKRADRENEWELIDGQQRLITIRLILCYAFVESLRRDPSEILFSFDFETRKELGRELDYPDKIDPKASLDHYHIHEAYEVISKWFQKHGHGAYAHSAGIAFQQHLIRGSELFWYEVPEESSLSTAELFERLNVGKIPLTDSELIKARLMTTSGRAGMTTGGDPEQESWRIEVGYQWDDIERELRDEFFWSFLTAGSQLEYSTRVDLIFDFLTGKREGGDVQYQTFFAFQHMLDAEPDEEGKERALWRKALAYYRTLRNWYGDHDLYHHLGYLFSQKASIVKLKAQYDELSKSDFSLEIKARIHEEIGSPKDETELQMALEELVYGNNNKMLVSILLLFNVESTLRSEGGFSRFPFFIHNKTAWSLEHIHAQSAEDLTKADDQIRWLAYHLPQLEQLSGSIRGDSETIESHRALVDEIVGVLEKRKITGDEFGELSRRATRFFTEKTGSFANGMKTFSI